MTEQIREQLSKLLVEITDDEAVLDDDEADLFEEGFLDSMAFVELLVALGDEFDIVVNPSDIERSDFNTITKIEAFVESRLS